MTKNSAAKQAARAYQRAHPGTPLPVALRVVARTHARSTPDAMNPSPPHYPGMDEHQAIEFFAATNDGTAIDGWHWLLEWSTTSFYIKSMNPAMQAAKVSIHGPDPKPQHRGKHRFRFDLLDATHRTGITLTESFAMLPTAAVSGINNSIKCPRCRVRA